MSKKNVIFTILIIIILISCVFLGFVVYKNVQRNTNKVVNILFNTDINYKEYTKVAIKSAIENKDIKSIYHINILCVDISQEHCNEFKSFQKQDVKIKLRTIRKSILKDVGNYAIPHYVTRTDLFKFVFSELFSDDKILYIDSDTLILKDLRKLYNTDISNHYLAAVMKMEPDFSYTKSNFSGKPEFFYNCGVLLLNLKKFRENNISHRLITAKNNDKYRDYQTQRIFNTVIPPNKIKVLSPIYNNIGRWDDIYIKNYKYIKTFFPFSLRYPTIKMLDKNSVIIHYSGSNKPWIEGVYVKFADRWWYYAKMIHPDWKPENITYKKNMSKE